MRLIDVQIMEFVRGQDVYSVDGEARVLGILLKVGLNGPVPMVPVREEEIEEVMPIQGVPTCFIDYLDGKFRIWPAPDRDITAIVTTYTDAPLT